MNSMETWLGKQTRPEWECFSEEAVLWRGLDAMIRWSEDTLKLTLWPLNH